MASGCSNTNNRAQGSAAGDHTVLCGLHDTNGGPERLETDGGKTPEELWHWCGVTMDADGRVIKLNLSGGISSADSKSSKLTGSLSAELEELGALEELNLSWNKLTGSIPSELGRLGRLRELNLRFNELIGSIPRELGRLGRLRELNLNGNKLTGAIPSELGRLGRLQKLNLTRNELSDAAAVA